jgi:hypothetical protein
LSVVSPGGEDLSCCEARRRGRNAAGKTGQNFGRLLTRGRVAMRSLNMYSNEGYEVVEVFEHLPRLRQAELPKPE